MIWLVIKILLALQPASSELKKIDPLLVENMRQMAPDLDAATAELHAEAATRAGFMTKLDPELLLAVAFVESRFDATATSRVEGSRRVTGRWPSRARAGVGPRFCGVMQTIAGHEWLTCLVMRDLDVGYVVGAVELRSWLRLARGDLAAALNGHGCGIAGMRSGCRDYAERVLARKRRLARRSS